MKLKWLLADEAYGVSGQFRKHVDDLGITYVVEIKCTTKGWARTPALKDITRTGKKGRPAKHKMPVKESRVVSDLWLKNPPKWVPYKIKETQKGPIIWEVRESKFFPYEKGFPGAQQRLLICRNPLTGEIKYFLSNADREISTAQLLKVAFSRWRIERLFQDAKDEVGFDHFEVRKYPSLIRHIVLTQLSIYFLSIQTERLREKKSMVDIISG
ncbi:transposase [Candidatus Riflebacteria bacterium]